MATSLIRKIFLYTLGTAIIVIAMYSYDIPQAGYISQQLYFDNNQHSGAPLSNTDLPVSVRSTDKKTSTSVNLPSSVTCESEEEICKKIKFIGNFSDADKRKYQSLIIKQIKNIDTILISSSSIAETLYSITLDSDKGSRR